MIVWRVFTVPEELRQVCRVLVLLLVLIEIDERKAERGGLLPFVVRTAHKRLNEPFGRDASAVISDIDNQGLGTLKLVNVVESFLFERKMEEGGNANVGGNAGLQPAAFGFLLWLLEFFTIDRHFAVAVQGQGEVLREQVREKKQVVSQCRCARRSNITLLLLEETLGRSVVDPHDYIAWLKPRQKAGLDDPVSAQGAA